MMLGDTASMAIASIWSSMSNWSTPTVLFCVLNLMIATIFIASNFKPSNHHHHHLNDHNNPSQLTRYEVNHETTEFNSASQLSHPPSLLQRVKSIDFSFPSFHNYFPTESERSNSTSELTRAPSLLDRVKSFKLTSRFTSDDHHHSGDAVSNVDEHSDMDPRHDLVEEHNNVTEQSFETSGVTPAKRSPSNLLKSRSERKVVASDSNEEEDVDQRRPATMKAAVGVRDESVDSKAEDFIKRFKQQLKLQRLDSLQRLKEMLNRGTSSG